LISLGTRHFSNAVTLDTCQTLANQHFEHFLSSRIDRGKGKRKKDIILVAVDETVLVDMQSAKIILSCFKKRGGGR
jgi:hypothetical protein